MKFIMGDEDGVYVVVGGVGVEYRIEGLDSGWLKDEVSVGSECEDCGSRMRYEGSESGYVELEFCLGCGFREKYGEVLIVCEN